MPQPKKFVYLKSGWPDMRCHRITFLVAEADRAAAGRAATEKVCVPKSGWPVALLEFVPNVSQSVTWWVYVRIVSDFCY